MKGRERIRRGRGGEAAASQRKAGRLPPECIMCNTRRKRIWGCIERERREWKISHQCEGTVDPLEGGEKKGELMVYCQHEGEGERAKLNAVIYRQ